MLRYVYTCLDHRTIALAWVLNGIVFDRKSMPAQWCVMLCVQSLKIEKGDEIAPITLNRSYHNMQTISHSFGRKVASLKVWPASLCLMLMTSCLLSSYLISYNVLGSHLSHHPTKIHGEYARA